MKSIYIGVLHALGGEKLASNVQFGGGIYWLDPLNSGSLRWRGNVWIELDRTYMRERERPSQLFHCSVCNWPLWCESVHPCYSPGIENLGITWFELKSCEFATFLDLGLGSNGSSSSWRSLHMYRTYVRHVPGAFLEGIEHMIWAVSARDVPSGTWCCPPSCIFIVDVVA